MSLPELLPGHAAAAEAAEYSVVPTLSCRGRQQRPAEMPDAVDLDA